MSHACTPILVGVTSPVLEILLLSRTAKFSFRDIDYTILFLIPLYSPWSSKNLIDQNRLKKFMQIGMDVTCMHTNFGGRDISSFGDNVTLKNSQFSLLEDGL